MKFQLVVLLFLSVQCAHAHDILFGDYNPALFEKEARIPIVVNADGNGYLTHVNIGLIGKGNGRIIFDIANNLDSSTIESAYKAVDEFGDNEHDYLISYDINANSISGKSSGAALSLGIDSLMKNWTYDQRYIVSGDLDGRMLMDVGGISLKIPACANRTIILREGQTEYIYEKKGNSVIARRIDLALIAKENKATIVEESDFDTILKLVEQKV